MEDTTVWVLLLWLIRAVNRAQLTPIVGGQIVKSWGDQPKYPYMVSLQDVVERRDSSGQVVKYAYQHFCGGSLINAHWILTAAHCIWEKQVNDIAAAIGHENILDLSEGQYRKIAAVESMRFQTTSYENDIALLRLQVGAPVGTYAKLPEYGMKPNRQRSCTIMGYGATQHAGEVQTNLIEGEVNVITNKRCAQFLGRIWAPQKGDNSICALGNNQDTCQGDSGGPLMCSFAGEMYIFGIVSHGPTCGVGVPSIYTVTLPYLEWIKLNIND